MSVNFKLSTAMMIELMGMTRHVRKSTVASTRNRNLGRDLQGSRWLWRKTRELRREEARRRERRRRQMRVSGRENRPVLNRAMAEKVVGLRLIEQ